MTSTITSESQALGSPPILQQPRSQEQPQLQHQQQPLSSLMANVNTGDHTNPDAEKNKKLLEWELSTLEANDLRSHAWYHGEFVGRVEAERLLRKCVAEEHGIRITTTTKINNTNNINIIQMTENTDIITNATVTSIAENVNGPVASREGEEDIDSDSDNGLEDVSSMSSDGDFAMDDYLDELIDNECRLTDPSMFMTTASLINQRRRMNSVLPIKRPKRQPRQRKYFYCFLVRASVNVKPPGRYVVSCLRVDKYDDADDKRKNGEDERSQKKRLQRQLKRRQLRQQRHPVLHFVINEIILQPGTVYERSQFTFGDSLPSVASFGTMSHNQRPIQPGFDSVPDLIRYYVGSAGDDAVLSYGGGNEGMLGSSTISSPTVPTEVRIRYPCNRRKPLMNEIPTLASVLKAEERTRQVQQHSHALAMAAALAKTLPVPNACTIVPVEPKFPSQQHSNWTHGQSTFKPLHRRTPSATITSATITSIPSSTAGSATLDKQFDKSLPGPSKIISNSLDTEFTLPLNRSSTTLSRPSTSSSPRPPLISESLSSSLNRSSTTLPRPSTSTSQSFPSTSRSSSNSDILKMALLPSTSSSPVTKSKVTPNASISESSSLSSSFSSLSKFASSTNISNNKLYSQIELAPSEPSTSTGFSGQGTSGSSKLHSILTTGSSRGTGIIDMDAEIAAALNAENRISDDEFDFYHIPDPPVVRSSFARMDFANSHQNKSESYHRRSESHQSRSENRHSRPTSSRSRSGNRSRSSISGFDEDERSQLQEFMEPRNDQYWKMPLESAAKQNQSRYQVDRYNTRRQGELESGMQRSNVLQKNVGEWTIQDLANSEIERMVRTKPMDPDEDSDLEEPPHIGEENFEEWRSRWTASVMNRTSGASEQQYVEHLNQRHTQPMKQHVRSLQQGHEMQVNPIQIDNVKESTSVHSKISPVIETAQSAEFVAPTTIQHKTATSETQTSSSARTSNDVIVETMISRWVGIDSQDTNPENSARGEDDMPRSNRNFHLDILHRRRRRRIDRHSVQKDHPSPTGDNTPPVKDSPLPAEKHYIVQSQLNEKMTQRQVLDLKANAVDVTKTNQSSTTMVVEGIPRNLTTNISKSKIDNYSASHDSIKYNVASDYENISISNANHQEWINSSDKNVGIFIEHHNTNMKTLNQDNVISCGNFQYTNKGENSVITSVDYENIYSQNDNNSKCIENLENIKTKSNKQYDQNIRKILLHDDNESSTAIAAALLAVHLAIIGDPEDVNGQVSVAGTGRLAAALCRADGRAIVLPYRRHQTGSEKEEILVESNFDTCPLQVLGHPGPEGRRARLDIIERFACLQYLVEITVIVTPCLLLIGDNSRESIDRTDKQIEWTLEDEYEYRRRLFYYQCAGIGSWYFSDGNPSSDDEESSLTFNSDFDSHSSLPTKEEWATEKRHWLDLLTRHRAAALDKWIRTAADAKQAVGDVYGYRALMAALCSDRIQTLRDAWATLRRIHTTTAVAFESRLRPEFLGRRDQQVSGMVSEAHDLNNDDMDALLQLPPNATVPDPTALAVLYEHLYNENRDSENPNPSPASSNDVNESTPMFTSPLLLSPSLWSSSNSGIGTISGGLGTSVTADYGLRALHDICVQYSKWVQSYNNENSTHSSKLPMLQLERFRRNFRTLLRQYNDGSDHDDDEYVYDDSVNLKDRPKTVSHHEKSGYNRDDEFAYERNYENKMEEFGIIGGDYDDCGDDDEDDDATVICCNAGTNLAATKITKEKSNCSWIKAAIAHGQGPAPLDIVFRTELHVRLFWPPTLMLDDIYDEDGHDINENHQLVVPAYALGTTYTATAATSLYSTSKVKRDGHHTKSVLTIDQIINAQLNRAAQDMHLRYKIMDDFLDKACSYSTLASKIVNNAVKDKHQQ